MQKLHEFGGKLELIWNKGLLTHDFPRAELESELQPKEVSCQTDRKIPCEERTTDSRAIPQREEIECGAHQIYVERGALMDRM